MSNSLIQVQAELKKIESQEITEQFKLSSDTVYITATETSDTTHTIFDLAAGTYDFRVKAINTVFVSSTFSQTTKELFGLRHKRTWKYHR